MRFYPSFIVLIGALIGIAAGVVAFIVWQSLAITLAVFAGFIVFSVALCRWVLA